MRRGRPGPGDPLQQLVRLFAGGLWCEVQTRGLRLTRGRAHLAPSCDHQSSHFTASTGKRDPLSLRPGPECPRVCSRGSFVLLLLLLIWCFSSLNAKCRCLARRKSPRSCSLSHFVSVPTRKRTRFPESHFTGALSGKRSPESSTCLLIKLIHGV